MQKQRGVEGETRVRNVIPIHMEAVRHQRVPVVQVAELEGDTIAVLEALAEDCACFALAHRVWQRHGFNF